MRDKIDQELTGYPSIDKPWLKYYSDEAINGKLPECTFYEYMYENNKNHQSEIALKYYGKNLSYGDVFGLILDIAKSLASMGICSGDVVTVMSMNTPETICTIYALNYIGVVANIVYMTLSETEIVETVCHTKSKIIFVLETVIGRVEKIRHKIGVPIVVLGISDSMPAPLRFVCSKKSKKHSFIRWKEFIKFGRGWKVSDNPLHIHNAPAVIVYTSGTTGEPKGVLLSNYSLNAVVAQLLVTGKGYKRNESTLLLLPPFFGFGIAMLHLTLSAGIEATICIDLTTTNILRSFAKVRPNRIVYGASVMEEILKRVEGDLSYLYDFTGGGAAVSAEKEKEMNSLLEKHHSAAKYTTGYGMTELASVVCFQMNHIYQFQSIGIPLPKSNVRILDVESGNDLGYDEVGEMCFSAPGMMIGYFNNIEATNEVIETDRSGRRWIHTGDLGRINKDGFLFFEGKIKRIYSTKDDKDTIYKIFPQRIEEFIEKQSFVKQCSVVAISDVKKIHIPIAFVVFSKDLSDCEEGIHLLFAEIKEGLPNHLWPERILAVETIPITKSGKVDYRILEVEAEQSKCTLQEVNCE